MSVSEKVNLDMYLKGSGTYAVRHLSNELKKLFGDKEYTFYPKLSELSPVQGQEDIGSQYFIFTDEFIYEVNREPTTSDYSIERFNFSNVESVWSKYSDETQELRLRLKNGKEFYLNNVEDSNATWIREFGAMIQKISQTFIM